MIKKIKTINFELEYKHIINPLYDIKLNLEIFAASKYEIIRDLFINECEKKNIMFDQDNNIDKNRMFLMELLSLCFMKYYSNNINIIAWQFNNIKWNELIYYWFLSLNNVFYEKYIDEILKRYKNYKILKKQIINIFDILNKKNKFFMKELIEINKLNDDIYQVDKSNGNMVNNFKIEDTWKIQDYII